MTDPAKDTRSINVKLQIQEFKIPPVHDVLVLGKKCPIGGEAVRRSLTLLHVAPFELLELNGENEDGVVGSILVRGSLLNKIPAKKLTRLIRERVKPFMTAEEVLRVNIEVDVSLEYQV